MLSETGIPTGLRRSSARSTHVLSTAQRPSGGASVAGTGWPSTCVCREARSASCCERVLSERRVERLEVYQEQGGAALYLPAGSRRMLSTPARNGPRLSTLVRRSRTVCPSHFDRSTVTAAGSRRSASPGEVRKTFVST